MNIKRTLVALSLTLVFAGISLSAVHAQSSYTNAGGFVPLAKYQNSPQFTQAFTSGSLSDYINNVFKIVLSIGGILAVLRIAYAGYMYMGSADMWGNKQHAKEMLADAIIGLLLLFGIYLILNQINPNLLNLNILKNIHSGGSATTVPNNTSSGTQPADVFNGTGGPINGTACQSGIIQNGVCTTAN